jgi:trans-aconitate methyltransferase
MNKHHSIDMTLKTLRHYADNPLSFWEGTKNHNVSQNINALLRQIEGNAPYNILDFGCGPGRDLKTFKKLGQNAYGLEGCEEFCRMAFQYSGCEVYQQNFIDINLTPQFYDGIFANASLFHVPKDDLSDLMSRLRNSLKKRGVLFSSNPRGNGESLDGTRYANFMEIDEYKAIVEEVGFELIDHYYRPQGQPVENCPWLACIFRKI